MFLLDNVWYPQKAEERNSFKLSSNYSLSDGSKIFAKFECTYFCVYIYRYMRFCPCKCKFACLKSEIRIRNKQCFYSYNILYLFRIIFSSFINRIILETLYFFFIKIESTKNISLSLWKIRFLQNTTHFSFSI